ncbi:Hypothetical protein NGAL_HAMBI2605_30580 [Neorhizobium galegae bv. orientalis]|nr:hypothetical protein [Neorhizobium galegae]CDZ60300.1 Hypothetical protein NGAL_HAMBI2566_39330 [Neorhizobium galegae bv. orientalis]CDZ64585.1 Hypothetical protein NGAL_HAMBI2605_30580 [Neorhizobium galegae bv. orientalis]CDZ71923.1 Hypothetical protein NGAL_HAMBI2610_35390 [Neorhizobium galegae bv. orientalis]
MDTFEQENAGRSCGTCTLCCRLPEIAALDKPPDAWCRHCSEGQGCAIYTDRPQLCRDFLCLWMTDPGVPEAWQPLTSKMLVYEQGSQLTVLVDPDHPDAWKQAPFLCDLDSWAKAAQTRGHYVILFCGDDVMKIEPGFTAPA